MEKYLITGFSGFISKHFCEYLERNRIAALIKGVDITDHDLNFDDYEHLSFEFEKMDLLSVSDTARIIRDFQPRYILHLASYSSVAFSWKSPIESFNNNTNIFLNILETAREFDLSVRILSVGSSEEYGNVHEEDLPLSEEAPLNPTSPYAVARVSQELLSKVYVEGYGLDVVLTRSFNHIGPRQRDIFAVASFARQLAEIKKSKRTDGTIVTGDVSIVRDFIDVRDVAAAYYLLLQKGEKGHVYNVCSGKGTSLQDLISIMADTLGININVLVEKGLIRPGDNRKIVGCNDKIREALRWSPQYSLEQSLRDTLAYWYSVIP